MKKRKFRISPGALFNYCLQEKVWFFWIDVSFHDSADHLKNVVYQCGGELVGGPDV